MKKIKNKYHLLVGSLLTTLLGFFGVSCGGQELLYGSPHAEYNVKGEVTNEDGEAVTPLLAAGDVAIVTEVAPEGYDTSADMIVMAEAGNAGKVEVGI